MAPNTTATDLSIGICLPNYVDVVNHNFAITTVALATAKRNVKDPPASEELLSLHRRIRTTFSLLFINLLTTAYFSSLITCLRLAFRLIPAPWFPFFLQRGWIFIICNQPQHTSSKSLLSVIGCLHTSVDLGFARLFSHDFCVCENLKKFMGKLKENSVTV